MNRVAFEDQPIQAVISQAEFQEDLKRGFCTLEFAPAGEILIKNHRRPDQTIRREVKAVLMFRCMRCQFDVADQEYKATESGNPRTGLDIIREHVFRGQHPWPYTAFETPYGNTADVRIEGITDYTKEIEAL